MARTKATATAEVRAKVKARVRVDARPEARTAAGVGRRPRDRASETDPGALVDPLRFTRRRDDRGASGTEHAQIALADEVVGRHGVRRMEGPRPHVSDQSLQLVPTQQ